MEIKPPNVTDYLIKGVFSWIGYEGHITKVGLDKICFITKDTDSNNIFTEFEARYNNSLDSFTLETINEGIWEIWSRKSFCDMIDGLEKSI